MTGVPRASSSTKRSMRGIAQPASASSARSAASLNARAAPELVDDTTRSARSADSCRHGEHRAGRITVATVLERVVFGHLGPDAAAHRAENPLDITGTRRRLDEIVAVGHFGDDRRLAV